VESKGSITRKMVDYRKFDAISTTAEDNPCIETEDIATLMPSLQPLRDVFSMVKGKSIISIGEASHGTHEFYYFRAELTKQLIKEKMLQAVLIEGDWPDTAMLHRFVTGLMPGMSVDDALEGFMRFPRWMWRNNVMRDFLLWLHDHNMQLPFSERCGIFGLDVYSLQKSMVAVVDYLRENDPEMAQKVRQYYACFDQFGADPELYGMMTSHGMSAGCYKEAVDALRLLQIYVSSHKPSPDMCAGVAEKDEIFIQEMNARVILSAETYYRAMFDPRRSSWNIRDTHFFETMEFVREHLMVTRGKNNVALWAHNSHLGNARFAKIGSNYKELNVGLLIKDKYPNDSVSIGQFTYSGTVMAASDWGGQHTTKTVTNALPDAIEEYLHVLARKSQQMNFALDLRPPQTKCVLQKRGPRLQRAIGVIYRPDTERQSHYYHAQIAPQFDIAVWFDKTRALRPLDDMEGPCDEPETFPSGF